MSERTLEQLLAETNAVNALPNEDPEHALIHYKEREVLRERIRELERRKSEEEFLHRRINELEHFIDYANLEEFTLIDKLAKRLIHHGMKEVKAAIDALAEHRYFNPEEDEDE